MDADWKFVQNDGKQGPVAMTMRVGVIHHPEGTILVDAAQGQATRDGTWPGFPISSKSQHIPAGSALHERNLNAKKVLLTHGHYDHIGGLVDLPGVEV